MEMQLCNTHEENKYRRLIESMGEREWLDSLTWYGAENLSYKSCEWIRALVASSGRLSEKRLREMLSDVSPKVRSASASALKAMNAV